MKGTLQNIIKNLMSYEGSEFYLDPSRTIMYDRKYQMFVLCRLIDIDEDLYDISHITDAQVKSYLRSYLN